MSMAEPSVSIIIPTFNRAGYLAGAIAGALAQDYQDLEVLVLDNASTDDTPRVAQRFLHDQRLHYFRNSENLGMVRNWRRGVYECAKGSWFLLLSDDDFLVDAGYIRKAMALATGDPSVVLVYANGYVLDEEAQRKIPLELPFDTISDGKLIFLSRGQVQPQDFTLCNVLFQRRLAIEEGAFQNPANVSCDSELFLRMCLLGKVGVCKDFVSVYRRHSSNLIGGFHHDYELLLNNVEMVLNPYRSALERGCLTLSELRGWRERAVRPTLQWTLQALREHHRPRLASALNHYNDRFGDLFWSSLPSRERLRLRLAWIWGRLGRRSPS